VKPVRACLWRNASLCGAPRRGLCKAPHDSGVCCKQFMMLLEEVLVRGGVSFDPPCTSRVDEGVRVRVTGRHYLSQMPYPYKPKNSRICFKQKPNVRLVGFAALLLRFFSFRLTCLCVSSYTPTKLKDD
jgi:hypothetical protein